tara:strand:- start:88 stop:426 length:339 start_codon:yes stop_codon:yes gene_type:complete
MDSEQTVPSILPEGAFSFILKKSTKEIISMILRQLGSNQTELSFNNGNSVFFSYETPVAGFTSDLGHFKTSTYYSRTTSKHINQYFKHVDSDRVNIVTDDVIVSLCHPEGLE